MEQLIISVGTAIAVSFGVLLLALVLKTTVNNSRASMNSKVVNPVEVIREPFSYEGSDLAHAIRGYDSLELFSQDEELRSQSASRNSPDDII